MKEENHKTQIVADKRVVNLPSGYFGIVLGIMGIGFAWRYAATIMNFPAYIGEVIISIGSVIWLLLALFFLFKAIFYRKLLLDEINHPLLGSFVSLFPATTMLVAIGINPYSVISANIMFIGGVVIQLSYASWQTTKLWKGVHPKEATTPGLYLPTVANNFISTMACGALGYHDLGILFFGAGVFSWLSLEPAILSRIRSHGAMTETVRTSLGIQLAPALVACSAYLSINNNQMDFFSKMLLGYGLLQLLFMIKLFPWYARQPFNPSFWSFSFGLSALAKASLSLNQVASDNLITSLAIGLFIFANIIIILLFIKMVLLLINKKIMVYQCVE